MQKLGNAGLTGQLWMHNTWINWLDSHQSNLFPKLHNLGKNWLDQNIIDKGNTSFSLPVSQKKCLKNCLSKEKSYFFYMANLCCKESARAEKRWQIELSQSSHWVTFIVCIVLRLYNNNWPPKTVLNSICSEKQSLRLTSDISIYNLFEATKELVLQLTQKQKGI